jgi:glutaminase
MFARYVGKDVFIDNKVFMSERVTGHRNRAIGHLMRNFDMVQDRFEESLELYFQQCSILVTCHDLAVIGATLANGGVNPVTGVRALDSQYVKYLLSVMLSCGMYDYAGEWAFRVGLPAKSGVAGGIVAVVPGRLGIGIFSPRLDAKGNSVRGVQVCAELSRMFGLHAFESGQGFESLDDQMQPKRAR